MLVNPRDLARPAVEIIKPRLKVPVIEEIAANMRINKGGQSLPYVAAETPYMVKPTNALNDRRFRSVVFCGPAQSGKTEPLILGFAAHNILKASDIMVVSMTQNDARDFSRRRVDRMIAASPAIKRLSGTLNQDNVFDKLFSNGAYFSLAWPSVSQLSSKPIPSIAITDYDRMPEDVDGEGTVYALALNRIKSFMSRGKIVVESSPGYIIEDPDKQLSAHEAPATKGILSLYNTGDRHRWYWRCPHCRGDFKAELSHLEWDRGEENILKASKTAMMLCPNCACFITPDYKYKMNERAQWLSEAEFLGTPPTHSEVTSFWMQGPAAVYQSWQSIVFNYLNALKNYNETGDEGPLNTTINTDQGLPYLEKSRKTGNLDAVKLRLRADNSWQKRVCPAAARFTTIAVDVQKKRFVVQVQAWGCDGQTWIVDRFNVVESARVAEDGKHCAIEPFEYAEDWCQLDKVLDRQYPVVGTTRTTQAMLMVCDSGGAGEATNNAYGYAARLGRMGMGDRFALLKGASSPKALRISKGKTGDEKINVPLFIVNTTTIKDEIAAQLGRETEGADYIHLPDFLEEWFYRELSAEHRDVTGWHKIRKHSNNEGFDLLGYNRVAYSLLGGERINWLNPPPWAAKTLGPSELVEAPKPPTSQIPKKDYSQMFRNLGAKLNG